MPPSAYSISAYTCFMLEARRILVGKLLKGFYTTIVYTPSRSRRSSETSSAKGARPAKLSTSKYNNIVLSGRIIGTVCAFRNVYRPSFTRR